MDASVKKFIEENIGLIEKNDFETLYNNINGLGWTVTPKDVSETLLVAGINPLKYMSEVPREFLYLSDVDYVDIPEGVEVIKHAAFGRCENLLDVFIPEGVHTLKLRAFMFCSKLYRVSLPSTLQIIEADVFQGCESLTDIQFRGTIDQFLNIIEKDDSLRTAATKIVCSDGTFDFE